MICKTSEGQFHAPTLENRGHMTVTDIKRRQTPEERELEIKQAELLALQGQLAQRELDLATLQAELRSFEGRYLRIVGVKYAELDELEARIAEAKAKAHPQDAAAQEKANRARRQADETARQAQAATELEQKPKFKPSEELKKLYREIAKRIHPDLANDEEDRKGRQKLMAEANAAYEAGDAGRLEQILHEWESSPESVKGEGIAADLIRTIRKINQIQERLKAIDLKFAALKESDLCELKLRVEESEAAGVDLLSSMAGDIDRRIAAAQIELNSIVRTNAK
jgi:hypothetical protein